MKTCEKCSTRFEISPQEKALLDKLKVGESQNCPSCREQSGKECLKCGGVLERGKIAGRTTVWCELCQGKVV
ncbi:hypothetical protein KJ632_02530 [Patescibacteria group bacterium]|nr:hypothetical protein [Patescibacteria group bacterium]